MGAAVGFGGVTLSEMLGGEEGKEGGVACGPSDLGRKDLSCS